VRYHGCAARAAAINHERQIRQDMQELRDRLTALKDRVSHVMARL
jgi:hypothetical protein